MENERNSKEASNQMSSFSLSKMASNNNGIVFSNQSFNQNNCQIFTYRFINNDNNSNDNLDDDEEMLFSSYKPNFDNDFTNTSKRFKSSPTDNDEMTSASNCVCNTEECFQNENSIENELNSLVLNEDEIESYRQYALDCFKSALISSSINLMSNNNDDHIIDLKYDNFSVFNDYKSFQDSGGCSSGNRRKKFKKDHDCCPSPSPCSTRSSSCENNINASTDTNNKASILKFDKPITNFILTYNLNQLNLNRKDHIIYLIERNRKNNIISPFDSFVHSKLNSNNNNKKYIIKLDNSDNDEQIEMETEEKESEQKNFYNYLFIKKLTKLDEQQRPIESRSYLKHNNLLPNCLSTFSMPFFFDIFSMTDLKAFPNFDMINLLKKSYDLDKLQLDYDLMTKHITENIVWNCLILYKKTNLNRYLIKESDRIGLFNFYLSFLYMKLYLDKLPITVNNIRERSKEIDLMLSYLLEALILNGLFNQNDLQKFKKFFSKRLFLIVNNLNQERSTLKNDYLKLCWQTVIDAEKLDKKFPLRLNELCRIEIKKHANEKINDANLNLPRNLVQYLNFDDEIKRIYSTAKKVLMSSKKPFS